MRKTSSVVAVVTAVIDFIGQFLAWSFHPGNIASGSALSPAWWQLFSFPVFALAPPNQTIVYFWPAVLLNCALWAIAAYLVVRLAAKRPTNA